MVPTLCKKRRLVLLGTGLRAERCTCLISLKPQDGPQERGDIAPLLQMRKLRLREVRCFAQGCTASKQRALLTGASGLWTSDGHPGVAGLRSRGAAENARWEMEMQEEEGRPDPHHRLQL